MVTADGAAAETRRCCGFEKRLETFAIYLLHFFSRHLVLFTSSKHFFNTASREIFTFRILLPQQLDLSTCLSDVL